MPKFKQHKDKTIKIFFETETSTGTIKEYIHPFGTTIKAYVRQLSANEQASANAVQDSSDIEFTINKRDIKPDMFVEYFNGFETKVYQVGSRDNFEFYNTEVKFRGYEVNLKTYIETRWPD